MPIQAPADLTHYEFNIRSFHPEKTFGWSGFCFEGDDRGFSLAPSGRVTRVTSRIWHRFKLGIKSGSVSERQTESDPSKAPWSDTPKVYSSELGPRGRATAEADRLTDNRYRVRVKGFYAGENHAMPYSGELQEEFGVTYVPTLDVNYELIVYLDPSNRHLDVVLLVRGDGFPNCEAFMVGPDGQPVFLGVHVRKGAAATSLSKDRNVSMIACTARLPLKQNGAFSGLIADHRGKTLPSGERAYRRISDWNQDFLGTNPNDQRCMGLETAYWDDIWTDECFMELQNL
ncbi:hypothetical protein ACJO2E_17995 [Marinobacter sp. M1N3S26]|uniref:hypothetical protein n=1 Tax=Marinobacter sp. M1N3S26 TaxID=3382299 RepID=UPI00387AAA55